MTNIEFETCKKYITKNFQEYDDFLKKGYKLAFVKKLKEVTRIGLKECKEVADYFFGNVYEFNKLNIDEQRRKKLKKIKKSFLLKNAVNEIKSKQEEELYESLDKLKKEDLYKFLEAFKIDIS